MKLHRDLLQTIWNAYTPGVIMYDKNNNFVNGYSIGKIRSLGDFNKLFDTMYRGSSISKPARHVLVMKLKRSLKLKEIKSQMSIDQYLLDNNVYITEHFFKDYVMDIGSPGWIFGKHPTQHNKEDIKATMMNEINLTCPDSQIPFFHLASGTVGRTERTGNFNTRAVIFHVDKKKTHLLHQLL